MSAADAAISVPKHWPLHVTSVLVHVIALARAAIADVRGGFFAAFRRTWKRSCGSAAYAVHRISRVSR
jgi:hypothetical protein